MKPTKGKLCLTNLVAVSDGEDAALVDEGRTIDVICQYLCEAFGTSSLSINWKGVDLMDGSLTG